MTIWHVAPLRFGPAFRALKWEKEKKTVRSSTRTHKKPNWLRNNVMGTKVERESSVGERQPSIYETLRPKLIEWRKTCE